MTDLEARLRASLLRVAEHTTIPDLDASSPAQRAGGGGERSAPAGSGSAGRNFSPLRARPRRRALVSVFAIVGGVVAVTMSIPVIQHELDGNPPATADPPKPTPGQHTNRIAGPGVRVGWVAYAGAHQAVASWDICSTNPTNYGPCGHAFLQTHDGWATSDVGDARSSGQGSVTSDGSVALWNGTRKLQILDADGQTHQVHVTQTPSTAKLGQALFGTGAGFDLWVYNRSLNEAHPLPPTPHIGTRVSAVWAPDGRLWVEGWNPQQNVSVAWSDDGGSTWTEHLVAKSGYPGGVAAGSDRQVAAFAWTSRAAAPNTSIITTDNGKTWAPFNRSYGPQVVDSEGIVGGTSGVATLPDGTIYVVDEHTHTLWTSTGNWHTFRRVPQAVPVDWVQANTDLVWAGHTDGQRIVVSADNGESWQHVNPQ